MIDIYDEVKYINNIIKNGFSTKWERDATLLIRYYHSEGIKKKDAKEKIKNKCEEASRRKENSIQYVHDIDYKRFNSIFEKAWKNKTELRQITYIDIPKEVVDWFLNLENIELSNLEIENIKLRRPNISIKNNKAFNFKRVKYLFTLYIWTRIQENYIERSWIHYLNKSTKRFKHDANLNQSFSLNNERDYLFDLGYIDVNFSLGIDAKFIRDNQIFDTPINNENRVRLYSGNPMEGDLYNPGYWLEKQKFGSFICENCGKEFAHYNNSKQEMKRKYCKKCADIIGHGKSEENKIIKCIDCEEEVIINKFDTKTCRCEKCQNKIDLEKNKLRVRKYREKSNK